MRVIDWRRRTSGDPIDRAFRSVELLTAVGATISALEMIAASRSYDDKGLLAWPITRTRLPGLVRGLGRHLDTVLSYPRVVGVMQTRVLSGLGLLSPVASRRSRAVALAGMTASGAAMQLRANYGADGSDHFAFINFATALVEKLFPDDRKAREFALAFIAAQSCMAYFTSGAVKMTSPVWRNGDAITGIFRTRTYGDSFFYKLCRDYPVLAKVMAWTVMVSEVAFPLVLVAPKPVARGILLSGIVFHLGNARFMGLNRFLWSFTGSYPAVAYFARSLGGGVRHLGRGPAGILETPEARS
jgi:hypothetical protein